MDQTGSGGLALPPVSISLKVVMAWGLPVLEDREVRRGEAADRVSVPVEHRDIEHDGFGSRAKGRWNLLRRQAESKSRSDQADGDDGGTAHVRSTCEA